MEFSIGKEFTIVEQKDYEQMADWCNNNNAHIEVIDAEKNIYRIDENKQNTALIEYLELKEWFTNVYAYQEQKYRRLSVLKISDDDGVDPVIKLQELYNEAEIKRKRIQQLEKEVKL